MDNQGKTREEVREHHQDETDLQSKTGNKADQRQGRGDTNKNPKKDRTQRLVVANPHHVRSNLNQTINN